MGKPTKHYDKWRIRWTNAQGGRLSEVYNTYADAEFALKRHQTDTTEMKRGLKGLITPNKTINDLCNYWIEKRSAFKRSKDDDESIIRCHLRPIFGELKVEEFNVQNADEYVAAKSSLNLKTVHNHLTLLISMLRLAHDLGWLKRIPKIKKPKVHIFATEFRYLKTDAEIVRFLEASKVQGPHIFALYTTAIYTGMRQGELAGLRWDTVDLSRRIITIQHSFDGPTKSNRVRYVPIVDALLPILQSWKLQAYSELVFPNDRGHMYQPSARIFQEIFRKTLNAAGFSNRKVGSKQRGYMVFHDLRHTFASLWVIKSGDIFKLQKILGHSSIQMTMRYAHLSPHAFEEDYSRLNATINTVVDKRHALKLISSK